MILKKISGFLKIFVLLTVLGGCTSSQVTTLLLFSIGYTIWTDKLPSDSVLGKVTGKDCSTARAEEEGGEICQERDVNAPQTQDVPQWCYRSIAGVDCYSEEIPQYSDRLIK